jgi:hypothetical protein
MIVAVMLSTLAAQALAEESDHPINGFAGRLAVAVDEADGQDAVRRFGMRLGGASGHLNPFESFAKFAPEGLKSSRPAKQGVPSETHAKHAQAFLTDPPPGIVQRRGSDVKRGRFSARDRQRERRVGHDWRNYRLVERHCQGEVPGNAHPDSAHASAAALLVNVPGEGAKPVGNRAGTVFREHMPFLTDA